MLFLLHLKLESAKVKYQVDPVERRFGMQVVECTNCATKNRVDENKLATSEAKCGRCGASLKRAAGSSGNASQRPLIVSDSTFQSEVVSASSSQPVLLDCWAPWCGPCRVIGPIMDQLAVESAGRYRVAKLNVDENPITASQFKISSIPTMLIFKGGQLFDRLIGVQRKEVIVERLSQASRFAA